MKTLSTLIAENRVTMTATPADANPNMTDMPAGSSHYRCRIRHDGRSMTVLFSMGPAHTKPPTLPDVLDCLASDASGLENANGFEDWASEYGYDIDSRKAERIYHVVERQAEKLNRLLGDDLYQALLWETERQ